MNKKLRKTLAYVNAKTLPEKWALLTKKQKMMAEISKRVYGADLRVSMQSALIFNRVIIEGDFKKEQALTEIIWRYM